MATIPTITKRKPAARPIVHVRLRRNALKPCPGRREEEVVRKFTEHRRVHVRFRALTLALACGLSLAAGFGARDARAEDKPVAPDESAIGGRWVGSPHVLGADRNRCDGTVCKLTLDIVKCG